MSQYVYVLEDTNTGLLKIGISTEPERRARNISREFGCAAVVRGILRTEDARRTEQFLHNMLAERRVVGEWFDVPEQERGYLLAYFSDVEGQQRQQTNMVTLPRLTPPDPITPEWIQAAVLVLGSYRNIGLLFGIRGQYLSQIGQRAGIHRRPRLGAKKDQARELLAAGKEPRQVARELGMAPVSAWRIRRQIQA